MRTEQEIREELKKHIAHRKVIWDDKEKQNDKKIHNWIICTLEWVLGEPMSGKL